MNEYKEGRDECVFNMEDIVTLFGEQVCFLLVTPSYMAVVLAQIWKIKQKKTK